ncbi:hypothetical protein AeRB84_017976, partial [Aphanomyces euteiches]
MTIFLAWLLTLLTSGGLISGFGPVYTRLVDEKQWHDLCPPNTTEVCSDQEVKLQSIYSTGLLMNVLGHEIFGTLLDMIGPRYMTLIAYVFSVIGNVCMAYGDATSGTGILLVVGYAMIGFGGMGILFASLQLSMLFRDEELYTALLVAAMGCSGYVYILLKLDISRETFFLSYTGVSLAAMIIVYLVYPVHHIAAFRIQQPMAQKTARTQQLDKPARWTQELDDEFVVYYVEIAGRAHDVVSGGKCLKNAGWQAILAKLDGRGNIVDINQLKNRWKRLKEDYVDYAWLEKKFSGDGLQGIDDAKWAELDEGRKHKYSRFRFTPFRHYS